VQRIFRESANGTGFARLAKLLNREDAPAPKPKRGRAPGWSASTVRVILNRRKYLGDGLWNQTEKRDAWGQKKLRRRPETDWIPIATPPIIGLEEWQAVHHRLDGVRAQLQAVGAAVGNRRARDLDSKYLLSGFARCKVCGGSLGALGGGRSSAHGRVYGCLRFHKTGQCANGLRVEMSRVDTAVLNAIVDQVLAEHVVTAIVEGVMARLAPTVVNRNVAELRTALHGVDREIRTLTRAIAVGGELESLLDELRACEMLAAPIQFTPIDGRRAYRFEGEASFGGVLAGEAGVPTLVVPLRGFEPRSRG
jgi:Recombinase